MILSTQSLNQYILGLAKALDTRGFDVESGPIAEFDPAGYVAYSVVGVLQEPPGSGRTEISLDEIWHPLPERRWERREYSYDLLDRPRHRRRAFHLHDRELAEAALRSIVHEHCEEVIGQPACRHYLGRELPDGYQAIDFLMAAWVEPGDLGSSSLVCLD
ncbi:MAG TPA: hypothetical protein VEX41_03655 [Candidatus Eisenbacteria bacterium]|nr:hypothetical protein [Candidatus Eisenbacteria bacterium]